MKKLFYNNWVMKKVPLIRTLVILTTFLLASCGSHTVSSSKEESSSFANSSQETTSSEASSSAENSSSTTTSSSETTASSSRQENSSSLNSSSSETNSSNASSSYTQSSSSSQMSSSSQVSSSQASSSSVASSSSSVQSSSATSSSQASSSSSQASSSTQQSSSSQTSSSSQASSSSQQSSSLASSSSSMSSSSQASSSASSSSSSSSFSSSINLDYLLNYEPISTFSKRMPGEFEPCEMVKMCYPINMPLTVYKSISESNKILLLVNPNSNGKSRISQARTSLSNGGVNMDNVTFLDMPIDSDYGYWVRDFSPFYVFDNQDLSIVDFTYNRPRYEQNAVPSQLATYFNMPYSKMDITHTGGNLMQDGRGTAFSDDLVVSENNNDRTKVKNQMKQYTGTDNYVITIDPQGDYHQDETCRHYKYSGKQEPYPFGSYCCFIVHIYQ